jgi:hypothetical protein
VTVVEKAFLASCLCWLVGWTSAFFGHAVMVVLPLNMVDPWLGQPVPLVVGGCYEPSYNTLLQPLALRCCWHVEAVQHTVAVVHHYVVDTNCFH